MESKIIGKYIAYIGITLTIFGIFWYFVGHKLPIGRLPGDIYIKKPGMTFYFPITTCILVSLILGLILKLFKN